MSDIRDYLQLCIDDAMECGGEEEFDESEDCGRWDNGALTPQCSLAGTEWCDWECPIGLIRRIRA